MTDIYEPWTRLVRITVLGTHLEVPEGNSLLRQLQFVSPDVGAGRYCWNGECRYCEVRLRYHKGGPEMTALACLVTGAEGMEVTRLAPELRYNLAALLGPATDENETVS
jgi:hypothetical protein